MAPPKPYHPRVMRPATLAFLAALTLAMLALVEVSIQKLPAAIATTSNGQKSQVSSSLTLTDSLSSVTELRRDAPVSTSVLPLGETQATTLYPAYTKRGGVDLMSFTLTSR